MASYGLNEYSAEVELDIAWRQDEVRAIARSIDAAKDESVKVSLRRALITLLYAHAEGGTKVAIAGYVRVINEADLRAEECLPHIVATSMDDLFRALSDPVSKHDFFRNRLPDDAKLHRFARQAEFLARSREREQLKIKIDEREAADAESNVDQAVLAKMLFRLGFAPDGFARKLDGLQYLRALRNAIAHGDAKVATPEHCQKYEKTVFNLLLRLRDLLTAAIRQKAYLRARAA